MDNITLYNELENSLRLESKYCTEDGELLKNSIVEAALNLHSDLIKILLSQEKLKENFFKEINGILVFDKIKFQKFVMNKHFLPDSYTSFKNKIGLTNEDGDFIADCHEIVLSWPYKDCILEGGQTKEEDKRNEIFFNEILAPSEINRLTEPKVLTNFKRFDEQGEHDVETITQDDNLIIKGNNLLALHSLKEKYKGKVKLIYIDPPYNTGSDSFGYNDNFNHSSWLTFMKNRLETAHNLLSNDGVICVQCSFHEFAFLKLIMDDIFEKYLCTFNIQVRHPDRILTGDKEYNDIIEYTLIYSKNITAKMPKRIESKSVEEYKYQFEELGIPEIIQFANKQVEIYTPDKYLVHKIPANFQNSKKISIRGSIREKNSSGRFYVKYIEPIAKTYPPETIFKVKDMGDDNYGFRRFYTPPKGNINGGYYQGKPISSDITEKPYPNFFNFEKEYNNVRKEGAVDFRNGKKPEKYIEFLLSIFSKPRDIILDFHLGSGTTAAVSHKMGRRYIGIEQMDYIETIAVERLKKVIAGEQSGISESVNWKGGGSFIYCELAKVNQTYIDKINNAENTKTLNDIWDCMQKDAFLSWKINPQTISDHANDFKSLSIQDSKRFLIECLDKNLLYVPYSEIENLEFRISEYDKKLNNLFYQKN